MNDTTQAPCEHCRENHEPGRGFSFDGHGINSCDMYRSRIVTFQKNASISDRQKYGLMFAHAPETTAALRECLEALRGVADLYADDFKNDTDINGADFLDAFTQERFSVVATIAKAEKVLGGA